MKFSNKNKPKYRQPKISISIVTSIHPDYDKRVWKHARSVAQADLKTHLICPWNVEDNTIQDGVTFHTIEKAKKKWQRLSYLPFRILRKLIPLLSKVDLVHFHDLDLLPFMTILSFFKPVVYDVHENYANEMLHKSYIPKVCRIISYHLIRVGQLLSSIVFRNVVLVSPTQFADFKNPRIRASYITNYASNELIKDVESNYMDRPDAIVFTGGQRIHNGSLLLLEIAELVRNIYPDIIIYMSDYFSDQKFREKVTDEIVSRNLEDAIILNRFVMPHDIVKLLNRATIAIIPNLRVKGQINAMPTKLFEYMAAGLPIVSSDLPHQKKIIEGSECGIVAQPENPESFVEAIRMLIEDRKFAMKLGQNGLHDFQIKYSWESQIPTLLNFYTKILDKK